MSQTQPVIVDLKPGNATKLHRIPANAKHFDEAWLQQLLFDNPQLLSAEAVDPEYGKLVPLAREFPVAAGPIDLLLATSQGLVCVVETKLWRNSEAHRTVLAQVLDYAKDLATLSYEELKERVERLAPSHGYPQNLEKIVSKGVRDFDGVAFEEGVRRSLATGNFLIMIVGDQIRPQVALLGEIVGATPNLEFSLGLVEVGFYRLREKEDWPLLAVPTIVGRTHEVTRAVIKIRYEEKRPEVSVDVAEEATASKGKIDAQVFLKSLPEELTAVFRPYMDRWAKAGLIFSWGKVGFSVRYPGPNKKLVSVLEAYPDVISLFTWWFEPWGKPEQAYQAYRERLKDVAAVQQRYALGKNYVHYKDLTADEVRLILDATTELAQALTGLKI